jgi:hypothetical protein
VSIKVAMLKSGEDVISDIKEMYVGDNVIGYQLENPYVVKLYEKGNYNLESQEETTGYDIFFTPWTPLSADKKFVIPSDWVVTIYEPHEDVKNSYINKMEERSERSTSTISQ